MDKEFIVLYTHQKQKKAKTWHDGVLKASSQVKKAVLYDDKGSKLDSIYILAGDITLGEQLESDRYYILVEEEKKTTVIKGSMVQQSKDTKQDIKFLPEKTRPSDTDGKPQHLSSQGRCSGLKRKKSGFIPPRMIKAARQEHEEESQQLPYYSKRNPDLCSRSYDSLSSQNYHSSSIHRNNEKNLKTYGVASKSIYNDLTDTPAARQPPIVNSMASPLANYMNQLQKVCYDSQESKDRDNRLKSPWSVYGSNSSSPCTYNSPRIQGKTYESPRISEITSTNPRKPVNREVFEENEKSSVIEEQSNFTTKAIESHQNKYELDQNKPLNPYQNAGVSTSSVSQSMLNPIALRLACPSLVQSKSSRLEGETVLCNLKENKASVNYEKVNVIEGTDSDDKLKENLLVKGNTELLTLEEKKKCGNEVKVDDKEETNISDKPHGNLLESKRSMTEIMSLLKGKQTVGKSASNGDTHKHTTNQSLNSAHSQDDRLKAYEKAVKVTDILGDKITKEFNNNTDDLENTKSDTNFSKFEVSDLKNDSVMLENQSELEFHDAENNATFTISFSPLSNVTCSDDEGDNVKQNARADNESVLDLNFNKQSDTSDNKDIRSLTSLSENKRNDIKFRTSSQSDAQEDKVLGQCISSISVSDSYDRGDLNSFITEPETSITNMSTLSETRNDNSDCPSFASPADNKLRSKNECRDFYVDQTDILWGNSEPDVNNDGFGNIIADDKEICKSTPLVEPSYEKNEESDKAVIIEIGDEVSCTNNNSFERKSPHSAFNDTNISKPTENSSPFITSAGKDVETNQRVEGDLVVGTSEQDIPEEKDFIDLIDGTKQNDPNLVEILKDETLNVESLLSDKTYNESIDKKMTQSQDTLDYSCDTLSSSHSQQFSSAGLKAVPEIELKRRVPFAHSPGSNDLVCYRSANLNKIVAHHSLNQDETLQEPFCRNLSWKELKESAYGSVGCKSSNKDDTEFHSGICYKDNDVDKQGLMNIVLKSRENLHNSLHKDERGKEAVNFWQNEFANSVESKQDCESLLTQIDNIHDVNGSHLAAEEQLVKRKDTDRQAGVNVLPHPSELFGRNVKKKCKKTETTDVDMWGRENIPPCDRTALSLSEKIDEKLKGYKISGSVCSGASRNVHQQCYQKATTHTGVTIYSPFQRLTEYDGDISTEQSPSFFDDCEEERTNTLKTSRFHHQLTESPDFTVPKVCNTGSNMDSLPQSCQGLQSGSMLSKSAGRRCVFISDSDSSLKDGSPKLYEHNPFVGEETDEDYIYTQIYKPRPMVHDQQNPNQGTVLTIYPEEGTVLTITPEKGEQHMPYYINDNLTSQESSEEFFSQPAKSLTSKQVSMLGGLHLFREKQKKALKSKPFEDSVAHTSYRDKTECVDDYSGASEIAEKNEENCNYRAEFECKFSTKLEDCAQEDLAGREKDLPSYDALEEVSGRFSGESNRYKEDITGSNFSSEECCKILRNTVKLKKNSPQTNLSKWEKYHSPHSDEDLNLNLETVKSKVKDFSVIEKPSKLNLTSQIEKNMNSGIGIGKAGLRGTVFTRSRNIDSTDKGFLNEATRMQNVPNNPDQLKLPSSLSSMDSFDQLLADDKLDFDDPELDHLLLKHTNIEEKNGETAEKNCSKRTCERENSKSFPEYKPKTNFMQDRNLNFIRTSLDNNAAEKVECLENISDSDISFSLDDSFAAANTYHSLKTESNSRSSVSLRVPWKQEAGKGNSTCPSSAIENINEGENTYTAGRLSCKNRLNDDGGSCDKFMVCNSEKDCTYGDRAVTEAALVQNHVNLKRRGESKSSCINRLNSSCDNFMGYDSEEDSSQGNKTVIETPSVQEPCGREIRCSHINRLIDPCEGFMGYNSDEDRSNGDGVVEETHSVQKPCSREIRSNCINRLIDPCEGFMGYNSNEDGSNGDRGVEETDLVQKHVNIKPNSVTEHNSASICNSCKLSICTCKSDRQDFNDTLDKPDYEIVSWELSKPGSQVVKSANLNQTTKFNKRFKPPSLVKYQMTDSGGGSNDFSIPKLTRNTQQHADIQATIFSQSMCGELMFPCGQDVQLSGSLVRQVSIPTTFTSVAVYKNIMTASITEYLNVQLYELAKKYHHALLKVDISDLMGTNQGGKSKATGDLGSKEPNCQCGAPSKVVQVKKQGPNNGRFFYACNGARNQQCKFFQWLDEKNRGGFVGGRRKISNPHSLITYMKSQHVQFYSPCSVVYKCKENIQNFFKKPKWARQAEAENIQKKQLYLKLSHKGISSLYSKDDLWVISRNLDFDSASTFIARSTYYGPNSSCEVEIVPVIGYSPSNWAKDVICHALLAGNASSELSYLDNIKDHISRQSPPVVPSLLSREDVGWITSTGSGFQAPRMTTESNGNRNIYVHSEEIDDLVRSYIEEYHLNQDQSEAIKRVGSMFSLEKSDSYDSILLIHGVFGAGKSFLLSVIVLFLVKVFQMNELASPRDPFPWKLLVSSTTNVAVDRILLGLLDLGFEDFVRVGSVKKIAKPILPFSVHATGSDNQELKELQEMLRGGELTSTEKLNVRQGIDKLRKGENKKKLSGVRVVGVTCASCLASCISNMQFPLVLLDECSQMMEAASLLSIARFGCQKLLLVGDPKQLDPTIQGSDSAGENGLEQTMFDRLIKMGYLPTLLRTQYRCHPNISAASNKLFYGGILIDGVSDEQRPPVLPDLPTICLYDVDRGQECCETAGSYYNEQEAQFVVFLIQFLVVHNIEPSSIGVITLYRSQMARITDLLNVGMSGDDEIKGVQVSTVDAFQGGERDIIILSTVRTHACGFIDNDKRTNVALTRARNHLLIVGNHKNLSKNLLWSKVLDHCGGFPGGIQSADEARLQLEQVLDNLKQDAALYAKGGNSSEISQERGKKCHKRTKGSNLSETSQESGKKCHKRTKGSNSCEVSQETENKSGKRQKGISNKRRKTDASEFIQSPTVTQCVSLKTGSTDSSPLSLSGKRKNNDYEADSPPISLSHSSGNTNSSTEMRCSRNQGRSRHEDKLQTDLFDSDKNVSDGELLPFSVG